MLSGKTMRDRMSIKNLGWRSKKCNKSVLSFLIVVLCPLLLEAASATRDSAVISSILNY